MKSITALEELIKENEARVTLHKKQLANHESGVQKLSRMALASTEANLEEASCLIERYKLMLTNLLSQDIKELEEKERLAVATMRKKYFDAQDSRIRKNREKSNDQKLEALRIIDELPTGFGFEDEQIFDIATKSIELSLPALSELTKKLDEIKKDFDQLLKAEDRDIQELGTINYLIPIVTLHLSTLLSNIKELIEEENIKNEEKAKKEELERLKALEKEQKLKEEKDENTDEKPDENSVETPAEQEKRLLENMNLDIKKKRFCGFPKYDDWWIRELWSSHQAYFALYKWKAIINSLCLTTEQKKAWTIIFDRWVFIKKILNDKGELAFNYNFAFDTLLAKYAELEEELEQQNLVSMEAIIKEITKKEDFTKVISFHHVNTPYVKFKKEKMNPPVEENIDKNK